MVLSFLYFLVFRELHNERGEGRDESYGDGDNRPNDMRIVDDLAVIEHGYANAWQTASLHRTNNWNREQRA